ncbi:hypothetical protein WG66_001859 [Moniliophthora roreri]|nr:hypothetical protein WG66_001859 [Moniliophthora roreri]
MPNIESTIPSDAASALGPLNIWFDSSNNPGRKIQASAGLFMELQYDVLDAEIDSGIINQGSSLPVYHRQERIRLNAGLRNHTKSSSTYCTL